MPTASFAVPGQAPLLTRNEVADFLRVSPATVDRLARRRLLRVFRFARRVRFHLSDVDSFLKRQSREDDSDPYAGPQD